MTRDDGHQDHQCPEESRHFRKVTAYGIEVFDGALCGLRGGAAKVVGNGLKEIL